MKVVPAELPEVLVLEPRIFGDARGSFYESYNERDFAAATGITERFVQDNHSRSARNVLRGLHYQIRQPQGKLVRVTAGEIYDVAVDIRRGSPTFGKWTAVVISARAPRTCWIPPGFAHGYLVLSEEAEVQYKTTDYWAPQYERCIVWNDRDLGIPWPVASEPVLSAKDRAGLPLRQAEVFP
jgi:dTDP-4-dehydrorhamnose 3,5-epimerase